MGTVSIQAVNLCAFPLECNAVQIQTGWREGPVPQGQSRTLAIYLHRVSHTQAVSALPQTQSGSLRAGVCKLLAC